MIDILAATRIVMTNLPGAKIKKSAPYKNVFLFLVQPIDPEEFPVFFSVNRETKVFSDFSPWDDANPAEIEKLFLS